ncbi:MAG: MBL fold metallo-hydrolase [Fibrobacterota bacterium]
MLFLFLSCGHRSLQPEPRLQAVVFDVGQGDAALVTFPDGRRLLIDAGSDSCGLDTLLAASGVTSLDDFALTHGHADHIGGARSVLARFPVRRVLLPGRRASWTPGFFSLVRYIADTLQIDTLLLLRGARVPGTGSASLFCLFPDTLPHVCRLADTLNAYSLVLCVEWGRAALLFPGDINFDSEAALLADRTLPEAVFLKVPHHGSATSSSSAFLAAVRPRLSVISVGAENGFGHPADSTVSRLLQCGSRVLRTDLAGSVTVEADREGGLY